MEKYLFVCAFVVIHFVLSGSVSAKPYSCPELIELLEERGEIITVKRPNSPPYRCSHAKVLEHYREKFSGPVNKDLHLGYYFTHYSGVGALFGKIEYSHNRSEDQLENLKTLRSALSASARDLFQNGGVETIEADRFLQTHDIASQFFIVPPGSGHPLNEMAAQYFESYGTLLAYDPFAGILQDHRSLVDDKNKLFFLPRSGELEEIWVNPSMPHATQHLWTNKLVESNIQTYLHGWVQINFRDFVSSELVRYWRVRPYAKGFSIDEPFAFIAQLDWYRQKLQWLFDSQSTQSQKQLRETIEHTHIMLSEAYLPMVRAGLEVMKRLNDYEKDEPGRGTWFNADRFDLIPRPMSIVQDSEAFGPKPIVLRITYGGFGGINFETEITNPDLRKLILRTASENRLGSISGSSSTLGPNSEPRKASTKWGVDDRDVLTRENVSQERLETIREQVQSQYETNRALYVQALSLLQKPLERVEAQLEKLKQQESVSFEQIEQLIERLVAIENLRKKVTTPDTYLAPGWLKK